MALDAILDAVFSCLPEFPVSSAASLSAAFSPSSDGGGDDLLSALPDDLLRYVVSRLPAKDAARTAVLSPRWRGLWRSTPLVLDDGHLFPPHPHDHRPVCDEYDLVAAVSRVLASHPGPFSCVRILQNHMVGKEDALEEWLRLLAAKGVENLVLFNRPWPIGVPLPGSILRCGALLRRLYLGVWEFPDTTGLPRGSGVFPHLRELGICHTLMAERDLEHVLACSPKLKILAFIVTFASPLLIRIGSHSLRCVLFWLSIAKEIALVDAPCLQQLILYRTHCTRNASTIKVKIGHAPELTVLGYLETAIHELQIGNTIIKAGVTDATANAMVPSVKVLALKVDFEVDQEVMTMLSFLRCFPHVETLHVLSAAADEDSSEHDDDADEAETDSLFWEKVGPIECLQSHVKKVVLDQFTGGTNELVFLKLTLERAQMLQKVVVVLDSSAIVGESTLDECLGKLVSLYSTKSQGSTKWASEAFQLMAVPCPRSGTGLYWSYHRASDFSLSDPFPAYGME